MTVTQDPANNAKLYTKAWGLGDVSRNLLLHAWGIAAHTPFGCTLASRVASIWPTYSAQGTGISKSSLLIMQSMQGMHIALAVHVFS